VLISTRCMGFTHCKYDCASESLKGPVNVNLSCVSRNEIYIKDRLGLTLVQGSVHTPQHGQRANRNEHNEVERMEM